jgi:ring-1,2-phenylacetyl-CoA epoxidase subunit PaaC
MSAATSAEAEHADALDSQVRDSIQDLILVLADSKRLLGTRYAEWILGAPELEAGIAAASMAQDEWGHARLLYAMLKDFGQDPGVVEHERGPGEYRSMAVLDLPPRDWPGLIALNVLVDGALTVQLRAFADSRYVPMRQRVQKLLEEEQFHTAHGAAWFRRLAGSPGAREALRAAVQPMAPRVLGWFGPDSERAAALEDADLVDGAGSTLRRRWIEAVAPLVSLLGEDVSMKGVQPDFADFDEARRRAAADGAGPDQGTIARVRGDRNRAFLMD